MLTSLETLCDLECQEGLLDAAGEISILIAAMLVFTFVLELFSLDTVRAILKQPDGLDLYLKAWALNFLNPLLIGLPLYPVAAQFFCIHKPVESVLERMTQVAWVVVSHAVQYYAIHKWFHENPKWYKRFHSFHHRFNTYTPPSSGNAVTMGEFLVAYILPFVVSCMLVPVHPSSLLISTYILQITHVMVHTPKLEEISERLVPSFLVSTKNHQDHHRLLHKHYASPTVDVDTILSWMIPEKEKNT